MHVDYMRDASQQVNHPERTSPLDLRLDRQQEGDRDTDEYDVADSRFDGAPPRLIQRLARYSHRDSSEHNDQHNRNRNRYTDSVVGGAEVRDCLVNFIADTGEFVGDFAQS